MWPAALDRQRWDQVRAVLLNPERNTNVRKATRYLLTGLIHCGDCGAALFSRPRNNSRRYLCAGRRPGHQLGIIADPVDELVKEFVLGLLSTPSVREALLAQAGEGDDATLGRTIADLGAAQSRLQADPQLHHGLFGRPRRWHLAHPTRPSIRRHTGGANSRDHGGAKRG